MKDTHKKHIVSCLMKTLLVLVIFFIIGACEHESRHPSESTSSSQQGLSLKIVGNSDVRAKAKGLTVRIFRLKEDGMPEEPPVYENSFPIPDLSIPVTLDPPPYLEILPPRLCHYRITATAILSRGEILEAVKDINACNPAERQVVITFDTYEPFIIIGNPIRVLHYNQEVIRINASGDEDGMVTVYCGGTFQNSINAPDSDRYALSAKLWEDGNEERIQEDQIQVNTSIEEIFKDPYWLKQATHHKTERTFRCTIRDERGTEETFTKTIGRILPDPLTVELACDFTNGLTVTRSDDTPHSVKIKIKGLSHNVTIPAKQKTVAVATWTPGQTYKLQGAYTPEFDPTTGQFYENGKTSSVTCPKDLSITISPVCPGSSVVTVSSSQPVAQSTTAVVLEGAMPLGGNVIPAGASVGTNFSCTPGATMSIGTITPPTDGSGSTFVTGGTCVCLP
jgi:hypothetical protein